MKKYLERFLITIGIGFFISSIAVLPMWIVWVGFSSILIKLWFTSLLGLTLTMFAGSFIKHMKD